MAMPRGWQKILDQHSIEAGENAPWLTEALLFTQTPLEDPPEMLNELASALAEGKARHHRLILTEHPATYAVVSGSDCKLALTPEDASARRIRIVHDPAGGHPVTAYYGPGMLNLYVAMSLDPFGGDAAVIAGRLMRTGLDALTALGIEGCPSDDGRSILAGPEGAAVATLAHWTAPGVAFGRLSIHTNTETAEFEEILDSQDNSPAVITLAELGFAVTRQDEIRQTLLAKYEIVFESKLHIPQSGEKRTAKPPWLRVRAPYVKGGEAVRGIIKGQRLHTVCESAHCPNMGECWASGTATFMINGNVCTRSCSFCAIYTGRPDAMDGDEPRRVAEAAAQMNLKFIVVTAVNRDDLPDGGALAFARTIQLLREAVPGAHIEVLIPDFLGDEAALQTVFDARPDVLNHNIETVPRLYRRVRPQARYERSLEVIRAARAAGLATKSGFMLGLGEEDAEVEQTMKDLLAHDCQTVTIGQYLRPSEKHHPVIRYATPAEFNHWREAGMKLGFANVESGPLVRSSYHAHESFKRSCNHGHS